MKDMEDIDQVMDLISHSQCRHNTYPDYSADNRKRQVR